MPDSHSASPWSWEGLLLLPPSLATATACLGVLHSAGDPSRGLSLRQWLKAQRSHPKQGLPAAGAWLRSHAAAGLSWAPGRLQAGVPPGLHPIRRGAQAKRELSQGTGLPALSPARIVLLSASDLPFLLGKAQVGDIWGSPWDESPSEEVFSPSPPMGLAAHPVHHAEGHPLPLGISCQAQTCHPCSGVLDIQA